MNSIDHQAPPVIEQFEGMAYYGIEKYKLSDFVIYSRLTGNDRIAPVGSAPNSRYVMGQSVCTDKHLADH